MDCLDLPIHSTRSLADVGHITFQHLVWKTTKNALFALKIFSPPSLNDYSNTEESSTFSSTTSNLLQWNDADWRLWLWMGDRGCCYYYSHLLQKKEMTCRPSDANLVTTYTHLDACGCASVPLWTWLTSLVCKSAQSDADGNFFVLAIIRTSDHSFIFTVNCLTWGF